jgi:hypothetical protein
MGHKKVTATCPECGAQGLSLSLTYKGHVVSLAGAQMKLEMQPVPQLWCSNLVEDDPEGWMSSCAWEQDGWIDVNGMACFTNPLKKLEDQA